jgi:hypothetical protein
MAATEKIDFGSFKQSTAKVRLHLRLLGYCRSELRELKKMREDDPYLGTTAFIVCGKWKRHISPELQG